MAGLDAVVAFGQRMQEDGAVQRAHCGVVEAVGQPVGLDEVLRIREIHAASVARGPAIVNVLNLLAFCASLA